MVTSRKTSVVTGWLFLIAMAASLTGGAMIESVVGVTDFMNSIAANPLQIKLGIVLEFINALSVIGIAVMMFPVLKQNSEKSAVGYLGLRIMESIVCVMSAFIPIVLITLSREYIKANPSEGFSFQSIGIILLAIRSHITGILIPLFYCTSALIFYILLLKTKFLPRFIAIWGILGVALIVILNILRLNNSIGMFFALPIILNEMFLGVWLIVKGFKANQSLQ